MQLRGATVLLTGAARGIGRALFDRLRSEGVAHLIVIGRDARALDALDGGATQVTRVACDLGDGAAVAALLARIAAAHRDLSVVINNAGTQVVTDVVQDDPVATAGALAGEIAVNLTAPITIALGLLPLLRAQPAAAIVNVTSGLALAPKASAPGYCATKAGLRSFTKSLRAQLRTRAPHVAVIEALPPLVATDMTAGRHKGAISPAACAAQIIDGVIAGRQEIFVGKSRLLRAIQGVSPALADRAMRDL